VAPQTSASESDDGRPDGRLLELIGDTIGLLELDEFHRGLLDVLRRLVPADHVSLSDVGADQEPVALASDPPSPAEPDEVSARHPHRIDFTLPDGQHRTLGVALSRASCAFTAAERELLELARPFLIQAYRNAVRYTELLTGGEASGAVPGVPELERLRALGLTDRQAEVLQILATGAAERDIGERLGISHRTVQKHLQRCYRQLGVSNRSRAAAIAWETIDSGAG
jgi:DNA-binding CsgD family transcriptional regulator